MPTLYCPNGVNPTVIKNMEMNIENRTPLPSAGALSATSSQHRIGAIETLIHEGKHLRLDNSVCKESDEDKLTQDNNKPSPYYDSKSVIAASKFPTPRRPSSTPSVVSDLKYQQWKTGQLSGSQSPLKHVQGQSFLLWPCEI